MASRYAFFTPTCRRDLAHFRLLRSSIRRFAPDMPHVAAVQTEDLPAFAEFADEPNLRLLPTAELLPADIERERRKRAGRPMRINRLERSLQKRFGWFPRASHDGWHCQQLAKFQAAMDPAFDGIILLDSDALLTQPYDARQFEGPAGTVPVYASWQAGVAPDHWMRAAHQLLELPLPQGGRWWYVAQPSLFARVHVSALCQRLASRFGKPWQNVLLDQRPGDLSEFTLYGVYGQFVAAPESVCFGAGDQHTRWVFTAEDRARLDALLDACFAPGSPLRFMVIQSDRHFPVEGWQQGVYARLAAC